VLVHAADVGEREGARWLLEGVLAAKQAGRGCFERLKHLWVDAGYQSKEWVAWIETALGWTVEVVRKPRRSRVVPRRRRTPAHAGLHSP
jgi:transposase